MDEETHVETKSESGTSEPVNYDKGVGHPSFATEISVLFKRVLKVLRALCITAVNALRTVGRFGISLFVRFRTYVLPKETEAVRQVNARSARLFYRITYTLKQSVKFFFLSVWALIRFIMPVVVPAAGVAAVVACVVLFNRYTVALQVVVDDSALDIYVENEEVFNDVRDRLTTALYKNNNGEFFIDSYSSLQMVVVDKDKICDRDEVFDVVYGIVSEGLGSSYGVYLDGQLLGTLRRESDVLALQRAVIGAYVDDIDSGNWSLLNDFSYVKGQFDKQYLSTYDEMIMLFASPVKSVSHTVRNGETALSVAQMYGLNVPELKLLNPGLNMEGLSEGAIIEVGMPEYKISVSETSEIQYNQIIPYQTFTTESEDYFEGTSVVVNTGSTGLYSVNVSVVRINGIEISRTETSRTKIKDAITRHVVTGTKTLAPSGEFLWPLKDYYRITSYYGWRTLYGKLGFHRGLDIAASYGTQIYAADDGTIYDVGWEENGLGNYVKIDHGNGIISIYGHCSRIVKSLKKGMAVKKGTVIAYVGSTGNSTGNHLHFALQYKVSKEYINPLPYLRTE